MQRTIIAILLFAVVFAAVPRLESMAAGASTSTTPATVFVQLQPQNNSGQTGTATLTAAGDKTQVVIALNGMPPNAQEPAHVHPGTCAKLNPKPVYPLTTIAGGQSASTIDVPLSTLQSGTFAINVHESTTNIGTYVACGNIPSAAPAAAPGGS